MTKREQHIKDECKCGHLRIAHFRNSGMCITHDATDLFGIITTLHCPCGKFRLKREYELEQEQGQ